MEFPKQAPDIESRASEIQALLEQAIEQLRDIATGRTSPTPGRWRLQPNVLQVPSRRWPARNAAESGDARPSGR